MIAKLIVATGKSAGRSIAIKRNKLLIGRAEECDIRPLSEEVSRRHCQVTVGPAEVWVEDLGSRNGTHVNNVRITERTKVSDGDLIKVGSLELRVSCTMPTAPPPSTEDDVSRWLLADDQPAGMSDTTRTVQANPGDSVADLDASSIHGATRTTETAEAGGEGSFVSGIDAVPKDDASNSGSRAALEALKAAKSKPGGLPQGAAKQQQAADSRGAAAEALKKFFERK